MNKRHFTKSVFEKYSYCLAGLASVEWQT